MHPKSFLYATVGVLFVNVSIGGTLTPYAAPPVLMVAEKWGLDTVTMLKSFGWKAALAVLVNAPGVTFLYRMHLRKQTKISPALARLDVPPWVVAIHVLFLTAVVVFSHHPVVFIALLLFFLGFADQAAQEEGDQQGFAKDEATLPALVRLATLASEVVRLTVLPIIVVK